MPRAKNKPKLGAKFRNKANKIINSSKEASDKISDVKDLLKRYNETFNYLVKEKKLDNIEAMMLKEEEYQEDKKALVQEINAALQERCLQIKEQQLRAHGDAIDIQTEVTVTAAAAAAAKATATAEEEEIKPRPDSTIVEEPQAVETAPVKTRPTKDTKDSEAFEKIIGDFLQLAHTEGIKFNSATIKKIESIKAEIEKFRNDPYVFIDKNTAISADQMEIRIARMQAAISDYQEFLKWQDPEQSIKSLDASIKDLTAKLEQLNSLSVWTGDVQHLTSLNLERQKNLLREQIHFQEEAKKYYEVEQKVINSLNGDKQVLRDFYDNTIPLDQRSLYQRALERYCTKDASFVRFNLDGTKPLPPEDIARANELSQLNVKLTNELVSLEQAVPSDLKLIASKRSQLAEVKSLLLEQTIINSLNGGKKILEDFNDDKIPPEQRPLYQAILEKYCTKDTSFVSFMSYDATKPVPNKEALPEKVPTQQRSEQLNLEIQQLSDEIRELESKKTSNAQQITEKRDKGENIDDLISSQAKYDIQIELKRAVMKKNQDKLINLEVILSLQGDQGILTRFNENKLPLKQRDLYQTALEKYCALDINGPQPYRFDAGSVDLSALQVPQSAPGSILNKSAQKRMKLYELYQEEKPIDSETVHTYAQRMQDIDLAANTSLSEARKQAIGVFQNASDRPQPHATIYSSIDNPIKKVTYHTSDGEKMELSGFGKDKAYQLTAEDSVREVESVNGARLLINSDGSLNLPRIDDNPHPEASEDEFAKHIVHQFENSSIPNPTINLANIGLYDPQNPDIAKARILSKIVHFYSVNENGKVDEEKYKKIQAAILTGNSVEIKEVFIKPELAFLRGPKEIQPQRSWYNPLTWRKPNDPHFDKGMGFARYRAAEQILKDSQAPVSGVTQYNPSLTNPIKEQLLQQQIQQKEQREQEKWFKGLPNLNILNIFDSRKKQNLKESLVMISQVSPQDYEAAKKPNATGAAREIREAIMLIQTSLKLNDTQTMNFLDNLREQVRMDVRHPGPGGRL